MSARVSDQDIAELQEIIGSWMTGEQSNFDVVRDALLDLQDLRAAVRRIVADYGDVLAMDDDDLAARLRALLPEQSHE